MLWKPLFVGSAMKEMDLAKCQVGGRRQETGVEFLPEEHKLYNCTEKGS